MPKPTPRLPQAGSAAEDAAAGTPALAPAPDNGVPFAEQHRQESASTRQAIKRRGVQVNARVPEDIHDRFMAYVKGSRLPKGALIARALLDAAERNGY